MRALITYARAALLVVLTVAIAAGFAAPQTKDAAPPLPSNLWAAQTSPTQITLGWGRAKVPSPSDQKLVSGASTPPANGPCAWHEFTAF